MERKRDEDTVRARSRADRSERMRARVAKNEAAPSSSEGADELEGYVPLQTQYDKGERVKRKRKKGLKTWQKLAIGFGIPVGIILIVLIVVFAYISSINHNMAIEPTELNALKVELAPRPTDTQEAYYILVLGSDARPGDTVSRSDTMMLCRLDPQNKRVSVLSIPRDTKVDLPGYGASKINAAMVYGGPAGAVAAVSDFVGVKISHFVLIDFEGFGQIVDDLGGVMIDVPFFTSFGGIDLQPGPQNLDGAHALAFVRCRMEYATGDFQRAANQRALLKAVAKKILQEPPGNIPGLVQSSTACIKTDLTANQLIDLVGAFRGMDLDADMYTGQVPSTTMMLDEISYVITVEDQWAGVREKYVNGEVPFVNASNQPDVVD